MKIQILACFAAVGLLTGCMTEKCEKCEHHDKQAKMARLQAEAKVSKADAEQTALAKVPNGTVKEGELEKEHGKLIWSFDITTPGSKDIMEVEVDALTGAVLAVDKESPEDQAKEAAEDAAKAKKDKEDKD